MRAFHYKKEYQKLLTPEIVALLAQIHEQKGRQNLFAETRKDALEELLVTLLSLSLGGSLLGYRYALDGVVVAGQRIGRTIGFPTANLSLYEPLKLIPAGGVYVVSVTVLGKSYLGICNIGTRPTLGDGRGQIVETHILDFDEEIYGLDLRIEFISRLRDERKFDSLEDLKKQLKKDLSAARKFEI